MVEMLREIVIKGGYPFAGSRGYFHGWTQEPITESLDFAKTYALVEFKDGNVQLVDPPTLKFIEPYRRTGASE